MEGNLGQGPTPDIQPNDKELKIHYNICFIWENVFQLFIVNKFSLENTYLVPQKQIAKIMFVEVKKLLDSWGVAMI